MGMLDGCGLDTKIPFLLSLLSTNYELSTPQNKSATNEDDRENEFTATEKGSGPLRGSIIAIE